MIIMSKQFSRKIAIALILVNFTFIGMKVVLDGVNIVATAIFALPNTVQTALQGPTDGSTPAKPGDKKIGILTVDQANGLCSALFGTVGDAKYTQNVKDASAKGDTLCQDTPKEGVYLKDSAVTFFSSMN